MSLNQFTPSLLNPLETPPCPKCGAIVMLARIEPYAPGVDSRTFECTACDHSETKLTSFH